MEAARPSPGPGRKAARVSGQRMQKTLSRCGTQGRMCHTVPISIAEHGLWCPCQPILQGMEGCTAFPASPLLLSAESSPFPQLFLPHLPGETALLRGLLLPSQGARTPAWCAGQGCSALSTTSLGERSSLMGNGGAQYVQADTLGWGLSYWASIAQAFSLLRPDPSVPGSILTAETGGTGQPSSAMA